MSLVFAQVEQLEDPKVLPLFLKLPLHSNQPLAGGVYGEAPEVGGDLFTAQLLGHDRRGRDCGG